MFVMKCLEKFSETKSNHRRFSEARRTATTPVDPDDIVSQRSSAKKLLGEKLP